MQLGEQEVEYGFTHLRHVALLHYDKSVEEVVEALNLVLEGLGVNEEGRALLVRNAEQISPDATSASRIVLGYIAALAAVQHGAESG
jgi:hypothetical protein